MNVALEELNLRILKDNELEFLSEYLFVLRPVAAALNKLQAEKQCFYGCLLPTLLVTQDALAILDPIQPNDLRLRHSMPLLAASVARSSSQNFPRLALRISLFGEKFPYVYRVSLVGL